MGFDETIHAYFILDDDKDDEPVELSSAFATLKEHIKSDKHVQWITPQQGFSMIVNNQLSKKDVFVFEKFEGELFDQLQATKCLIVGPKCLINCLHQCEPVPLGSSPIFTTAMRGLNISATGLSVEDKDKMKEMISWMGGYYFQNLGRSITHLLSNTIKSTKYEHATLNGIPVMHVDWVQKVWERSCVVNAVRATDPEFDKYKLPVFYGANITCSGLDSVKKSEVMRLVEENGGIYNRAFRSQFTDIVITERSKANTEKYQAAIKYKKDVLIPEWIFDSVTKGFALPTKNYRVSSMKVSTPTKPDHSVNDYTQLSDVSRISTQEGASRRGDLTVNDTITSSLNDTCRSSSSTMTRAVLQKQAQSAGQMYKQVLNEISHKDAKKAGPFLDGCSIYLSGFRSDEKEKLNRILNAGGATRYDEVNDSLTHIVVGELDETLFTTWRNKGLLSVVNVVRLDWLRESIRLKQAASENVYRVSLPMSREPDAPSPSSKRTLRSMNHSFKQPDIPKKRLFTENTPETPSEKEQTISKDEEDELISQYSQDTPVQLPPLSRTSPRTSMSPRSEMSSFVLPPESTSTQKDVVSPRAIAAAPPSTAPPLSSESEMTGGLTTLDYENLNFFEGMSVYVSREHFFDEFYTQLVCECEAAHGNVVKDNFKDLVDYAIVSFEKTVDVPKLPVTVKNIVTELYVEECMKQNKLVPIEYYHKHISSNADSQPLEGMTLVISIYTGLERDFIDSLGQLLGANVNKTFVKRERSLLICPKPEGSKYEGAMKWRYPVVTSKWLLECADHGQKLPFKEFLVGDSPADFPQVSVLQEKNSNELSLTLKAPTPKEPEQMQVDEPQNVAPPASKSDTAEFTPLRYKRVAELAGPSRHSLGAGDSPRTPTGGIGKPSCNFALMDEILSEIEDEAERECLREVILEMKNNQTPELERIRRQACTPINRKLPTPKGIPDFCTTPEFEKRMSEEFERRWRLPTKKLKPNTPIEEIRKRVLSVTCKVFGIDYKGDSTTTPTAKPSTTLDDTPLGARLLRQKSTFQEKMDFEDSSTQSPEVKQISAYLKSCESRSLSNQKLNMKSLEALQPSECAVEHFDSEEFGPNTQEMVTWTDPIEFAASRRPKSPTMQFVGTPRFSISCSTDAVRLDIIAKINKLHGEVSENLTNYDPNCTHFLCERPNRGEKMLGCIASGKWVLGLRYIEECFAKNCFVDEELYEWGNPKAINLPELSREEMTIAAAAHRWRKQLSRSQDPSPGAFSGFKTILRISERHRESLKNVIKAGHGEILQIESPYRKHPDVQRATHCFVDVKKTPLTSADYAVLTENKVQILSQIYINAYLMNGENADVTPYRVKA